MLALVLLVHMPDRPDLNDWFGSLTNHKGGLCCSSAEGKAIADVDWDTMEACEDGKGGGAGNSSVNICSQHYRVRLEGVWMVVPDDAVITAPNKYGPAVVWPYEVTKGVTKIRCFMPGTMI